MSERNNCYIALIGIGRICSILKTPKHVCFGVLTYGFNKYGISYIIHGNTICGLSQLTKERISGYKDIDHVDWWIYKGNFKELEKNFKFYD